MAELIDETLTDLANERRRGTTFVECVFDGVDLEGAALRGCRFEDCRFEGGSLRLATVDDCAFRGCRFLGTNLMGVRWTAARWSSLLLRPSLRFAECQLDYASFAGLALHDLLLYSCSAREAVFDDADLTGASFRYTDLSGATFSGATLVNVDLVGAEGYAIDVGATRVRDCAASLPGAESFLAQIGVRLRPVPDERTAAREVLDSSGLGG